MTEAYVCSKGYRFPVISYAVYLYHCFLLSCRDVQELLFERGIDVSHETVRAWCGRFGPNMAEVLRHRKPRRGRTWHLDEMRMVVGGTAIGSGEPSRIMVTCWMCCCKRTVIPG